MKIKEMLETKSKIVLVKEFKNEIENEMLKVFKEIKFISEEKIKDIEKYPNTCFDYISNTSETIYDSSEYLKKLIKDFNFLNSEECRKMSYEEFLEQEFLCTYNIRK